MASYPGTSTGIRWGVDYDTGEENLWASIANLAKTGMNIELQRNALQAETQLQDALLKAEQDMDELANRLRDNPDEMTYMADLDRTIASLNKHTPKNGLGARLYSQWIKGQTPGWKDAVNDSITRKIYNKWGDTEKLRRAKAIETNSMVELEAHHAVGRALGRITPEESELILEQTREAGQYEDAVKLAGMDPQGTYDKMTELIASGGKWESHPQLDAGHFRAIRNIAQHTLQQSEADKAQQAIEAQRKTINNFTQKLLDPQKNGWIQDVEYNELVKNISKSKEEKWSAIYDHQADLPPKESDWKQYNKLESRIFDFWNGEIGADISDLQTELAYAYKGKGYLTTRDYSELLSRLGAEIPEYQRRVMQDLFAERKAKEGWYIGGAYEDIAKSNKALYDYVVQQVEKGKFPERSDMVERKTELDTSVEKAELPRPETEEEKNKLAVGTIYIDPAGNKRIKL